MLLFPLKGGVMLDACYGCVAFSHFPFAPSLILNVIMGCRSCYFDDFKEGASIETNCSKISARELLKLKSPWQYLILPLCVLYLGLPKIRKVSEYINTWFKLKGATGLTPPFRNKITIVYGLGFGLINLVLRWSKLPSLTEFCCGSPNSKILAGLWT